MQHTSNTTRSNWNLWKHFCSLKSTLYHMQTSKWCVIALFLKNDKLVNENCEMSVSNINGPEAIYLDKGNWAIASMEPDQMEISCTTQKTCNFIEPSINFGKSPTSM